MKFRMTLIAAAAFSVTAALAQTQPATAPSTRDVAPASPATQSAVAVTQPAPTAHASSPSVPEEKRDIPPALAAAMKACAAELATKPAPLIVTDGKFRDTYQVVVDRNIFTRTHYTRDSSDARRLSEQERSQRRQILVLTGVVEEGQQLVAFIENTRTNETERHAAGDSLVQGKVTKVDFDAIMYENGNGGQPIRVEVGMNLDGKLPDFGSSSYSSYSSGRSSGNNSSSSSNSAGATTPSAAAPSSAAPSEPAPPGSASDIAERLRQRRLQETKQGAGQ